MKNININRRTFLKVTTAAGSGLLVGCSFSSTKLISGDSDSIDDLGLWVRIGLDDQITLILPASEMGQHAHTGQAMLIAEELEVDWNKINVVTAPVHSEYKKTWAGSQSTGGSGSIQKWWTKLRQIGASSRILLTSAAAKKWEVPVSECYAKSGSIYHIKTNRAFRYGELVSLASKLEPKDSPTLKKVGEYNVIGKSMPKIHTPSKVNGDATYGIDIRIKGMLYASVKQSPVFGGELKKYNENAARSINGVEAIVKIPNGIAVVANSTWRAEKGMELLQPEFEGGKSAGMDDIAISKILSKKLDEIGNHQIRSEKFIEVEYQMPFLHHATMEPMNCTAHVKDNSCEVWVPTQHQTKTLKAVKDVTGFAENNIIINTTLMGGAFGRRLETDFVTQAVMISKSIKKPVQVIWSREEDTRQGFYRPTSMCRFQVGIDKDGFPSQWESQTAQPNLLARYAEPLKWLDFDPFAIAGSVHDYPVLTKHFYDIDEVNLKHQGVELGVPIGNWRSPPNSINVFYTESIIDELAYLAQEDPLHYRLKLIKNSPRHKKVLEEVAKMAEWGTDLNDGYGLGIAINDWIPVEDEKSIVAVVAKVHVSERGKLKIEKVDCVIDCGIAVNPDSIRAQIEGSIIMGMSATIFEKISLKKGKVVESNFDDYRIALLRDSPLINIFIIDSEDAPTGSGEPASSPIVPAITNAIYAAKAKRIRKLPIGKQKLV